MKSRVISEFNFPAAAGLEINRRTTNVERHVFPFQTLLVSRQLPYNMFLIKIFNIILLPTFITLICAIKRACVTALLKKK